MPAASAVSFATTAGAMIIRTGTAGIEVDSLDNAIARVRTLALRVNGFVANTTVQGGRDQLRSASLELKIPSERFDDALAGLSPIGKVESVNVSAEDVGEEYVDIAARVENAHRLEARIIDLLANRTGKLQDVLSVEQVEALLRVPRGDSPQAARDRALLETAYATGLRASELVGLALEEVDLEEDLVRCTGKRQRERIVPFGKQAHDALVRYLEGSRPRFARARAERTVFLTRLGRPFTRAGYWKLLRNHALAAGIGQPVSPHTLRHSCATHLLEGGCDLRVVQEFLGHRSIETTQIYTHLDRGYLREIHTKFDPRA